MSIEFKSRPFHQIWHLRKSLKGCIDLKSSVSQISQKRLQLVCTSFYSRWAQGNSDSLSLFKDFHKARYFRNIFFLSINANRLCLHVGLEF